MSTARSPFGSAQEVTDYVSGDELECLECGRLFAFLPRHLSVSHGMSAAEYRRVWAIPASVPLAGVAYRERQRRKMERMIADGEIKPAFAAAREAAAAAPTSRQKVSWQAVEQSERMRRVIAIRKPPRKKRPTS